MSRHTNLPSLVLPSRGPAPPWVRRLVHYGAFAIFLGGGAWIIDAQGNRLPAEVSFAGEFQGGSGACWSSSGFNALPARSLVEIESSVLRVFNPSNESSSVLLFAKEHKETAAFAAANRPRGVPVFHFRSRSPVAFQASGGQATTLPDGLTHCLFGSFDTGVAFGPLGPQSRIVGPLGTEFSIYPMDEPPGPDFPVPPVITGSLGPLRASSAFTAVEPSPGVLLETQVTGGINFMDSTAGHQALALPLGTLVSSYPHVVASGMDETVRTMVAPKVNVVLTMLVSHSVLVSFDSAALRIDDESLAISPSSMVRIRFMGPAYLRVSGERVTVGGFADEIRVTSALGPAMASLTGGKDVRPRELDRWPEVKKWIVFGVVGTAALYLLQLLIAWTSPTAP